MVISFLINFLVGVSIDLFYVLWFRAYSNDNAFVAVIASVLMAACSIYGFVEIVGHWYYSIPYLAGLGTGTYIGMRWEKWKAFTKLIEWLKSSLSRRK